MFVHARGSQRLPTDPVSTQCVLNAVLNALPRRSLVLEEEGPRGHPLRVTTPTSPPPSVGRGAAPIGRARSPAGGRAADRRTTAARWGGRRPTPRARRPGRA